MDFSFKIFNDKKHDYIKDENDMLDNQNIVYIVWELEIA